MILFEKRSTVGLDGGIRGFILVCFFFIKKKNSSGFIG